MAGAEIVRQGDEGDRFFVIAGGQADVVASGHRVATLGRGDGFGEIALMYGVPRTATVTARTDMDLYGLDREAFCLALTGHSTLNTSAQNLADQRLAELRALSEVESDQLPAPAGG